jgi:putative effector of murein hydrolase
VGLLAFCAEVQLKNKHNTTETAPHFLKFIIFIIFLFETEHKYYTFLFK